LDKAARPKYTSVRVLRAILGKLRPEPVREPLQPLKVCAPPRAGGSERAPVRLVFETDRSPPMTLGNAAAARVRLIVWCKECRHQVEPDPAEHATRFGLRSLYQIPRQIVVLVSVK
jgi:hypothetical protein